MAETTILFVVLMAAVYLSLRLGRIMRDSSKRKADERLKDHLNWTKHPHKPAV